MARSLCARDLGSLLRPVAELAPQHRRKEQRQQECLGIHRRGGQRSTGGASAGRFIQDGADLRDQFLHLERLVDDASHARFARLLLGL